MDMLFVDANNPDDKIEVKLNSIRSFFKTNKVLRSKVDKGKSPSRGEDNATADHKFTLTTSLAGKTFNGKFNLMIETKDNKMENFKSILCDEAMLSLNDKRTLF